MFDVKVYKKKVKESLAQIKDLSDQENKVLI